MNHYYTTFDTDRASLLPLYVSATRCGRTVRVVGWHLTAWQRENSMLSFEGRDHIGATSIVQSLMVDLPAPMRSMMAGADEPCAPSTGLL